MIKLKEDLSYCDFWKIILKKKRLLKQFGLVYKIGVELKPDFRENFLEIRSSHSELERGELDLNSSEGLRSNYHIKNHGGTT